MKRCIYTQMQAQSAMNIGMRADEVARSVFFNGPINVLYDPQRWAQKRLPGFRQIIVHENAFAVSESSLLLTSSSRHRSNSVTPCDTRHVLALM